MASLIEPLAKAQGEGMPTDELREQYNAELKAMGEVHSIQLDKGWLECKDLLAGETAGDKMQDYHARTQALHQTADLLNRIDQANDVFKRLQPSNAPASPDSDQVTKGIETPATVSTGANELTLSLSQKAFQALPIAARTALLHSPGMPLWQTSAADFATRAKAFTFSTGADGILPTDRMAMPYQLISALGYFTITAQAGSIVRFFQAPSPELAAAAGQSRGRARGAAINQVSVTSQVMQLVKQSRGAYAEIPREDIRDHGMVNARVEQTLDIALAQDIERQIFAGDNTGENWKGFVPDLSTAAANMDAIALTSNSVPVAANDEPVSVLEQLMTQLGMRGVMATVIFANARDIEVIRQSQRVLRNQMSDYERYPYGGINAVPLHPCQYLPANTAVIMDSVACLYVELGSTVETLVSEDAAMIRNNIAMSRTVDGQVALEKPYGAIKLTATDNFKSASLS